MLKYFAKMPVILALVVVLALVIGDYVPIDIQRLLYTFSLIIKELLVFVLPFIIFVLLFGSVVSLGGEKGTLKFILLLLICVCCSNFITTWIAFFIGNVAVQSIQSVSVVKSSVNILNPIFDFSLPKLIRNEYALLSAVVVGLIFSHFNRKEKNIAHGLSAMVNKLLNKFFIPIVPVFVLGFILKLNYDGALNAIVKNFLFIFIVILSAQILYILFLFAVGSRFNVKDLLFKLKNTFPAILTGFSTMSSAAALPITLIAAEKNTHNPSLSRVVIPGTVNIHLIGDCIAVPIFAFAIMHAFGMQMPNPYDYLIFTLFFVAAKFAIAAVPGGGIIVMLPILQQYLGFNSEMISIITALYILFDSVITGVNIAGNSAFAILFNKIHKSIGKSA